MGRDGIMSASLMYLGFPLVLLLLLLLPSDLEVAKNQDGRLLAVFGLWGPFLGPKTVKKLPRTKNWS